MAQRKKKFNALLDFFGIGKGKRADYRSDNTGKNLSEVYTQLQDSTGKHSNGNFERFKGDRPGLFGFGDYGLSPEEIAKAREKAQQQAKEDTQYLFDRFNQDYGQGGLTDTRNQQDYQTGLDTMQTEYDRTNADLANQQQYLAQDYATNQQQDALNQQIQNENAMTSMNQRGVYDSGRQLLEQDRLKQAQTATTAGLDNAYNRNLDQLNTTSARAAEDYNTNLSIYNRNSDRNVYDLNQYYNRGLKDLKRQRRGTRDNYLSGIISNMTGQ